MIKYFVNEEKKQVIGTLENTKYDVVNKINKMLDGSPFCYCNDKCLMPDSFKSVVTCDPADEFDIEIGKQIAKKRIMDRYYNSFDKRVEFFIKDADNMSSEFAKYKKPLDK